MGDVHVWSKSQNKFAQKQAFQWKHWSIKKRFKQRKNITYLFYCIVIMYGMWEGWIFAVWKTCNCFYQKKQLPRPCLCTPSGPSLAAEILSTDSLGFKMMRNDMHFQPLVLPQTVSNMARDFIASFNGQVSWCFASSWFLFGSASFGQMMHFLDSQSTSYQVLL